MLSVRKTTAEDTKTIHRFKVALQEHLYMANPATWRRDYTSQTFLEEAERETTKNYTLIAELDEIPVGYISSSIIQRNEPNPNRVGMIINAYVDEAHRNKGVASILMKNILEHFEEEKVEETTLRYIIGNREAEHYWRSLGFQPVITVANAYIDVLKQKLEKRLLEG